MFKLLTLIVVAFVTFPVSLSLPSNHTARSVTGGFATYYEQGGNLGACGQLHSDSDLIGAMTESIYGSSSSQSPLCGRQVLITNTLNGKSVTITIEDDCPTCGCNSIDLSVGAFTTIATTQEGMVPIEWSYV